MTQQEYSETPVNAFTIVRYKGKDYNLLGCNYLSGTIRLKGQYENLNADYSECQFLKLKERK